MHLAQERSSADTSTRWTFFNAFRKVPVDLHRCSVDNNDKNISARFFLRLVEDRRNSSVIARENGTIESK